MGREMKQSFKMLCHCEPISSSFIFQYLILKHRELEIWLFLRKHPFVDRQRFSQGMPLHEERKRVLSQKLEMWHYLCIWSWSLLHRHVTVKCFSFSHSLWHRLLPFCYRKLWCVNRDAPGILILQVLRFSSTWRDALHPSLQKIKRILIIKLLRDKKFKIGGGSLTKIKQN